jgi:hypothetical protein
MISFVGVRMYIAGEAGWRSVAKALNVVIARVRRHKKAQGEFNEFVSEWKTKKHRITGLNKESVRNLLKAVENGGITRVHLRTTRAHSQSMRRGHWFICDLAPQHDVRMEPRQEVAIEGTFPLQMFEESPDGAHRELLGFLEDLSRAAPVIYSYVNLCLWRGGPGALGMDNLYHETAQDIPISGFDDPATANSARFRHGVKGAFWLNILNADHVRALGGLENVREVANPYKIRGLPDDHVVVQVTPSPIVAHTAGNREAFARLRKLLEPITIQRVEEPAVVRELRKGLEKQFPGPSDDSPS